MKLQTELPHFRIFAKDGSYCLPLEQADDFLAAWTAGKAFWSGIDVWGQPLWIKLADIVGACTKTADALALLADEDAEEKRRKLLAGDDH